jgi:hypothetical protein
MPWHYGDTTTTPSPRILLRSVKPCMFLSFPSGALLAGSAVVCSPSALLHAVLNSSRHRVRLSCQGLESISSMVPNIRLPCISCCSAFRTFGRESSLPRPRLRTYWTRLRFPVWMLPFACGRGIRHSWVEHKLGLHDIVSCYQWEHLQLILRHDIRQAQHNQTRRRTGMHRRISML